MTNRLPQGFAHSVRIILSPTRYNGSDIPRQENIQMRHAIASFGELLNPTCEGQAASLPKSGNCSLDVRNTKHVQKPLEH